jgi:hypothetical protein
MTNMFKYILGKAASAFWEDGLVAPKRDLVKYSRKRALRRLGNVSVSDFDVVRATPIDSTDRFVSLFSIYRRAAFDGYSRGPPCYLLIVPPLSSRDIAEVVTLDKKRADLRRPLSSRSGLDSLEFLKSGPSSAWPVRRNTILKRYRQLVSVSDNESVIMQEDLLTRTANCLFCPSHRFEFGNAGLPDYYMEEIGLVLRKAIHFYEQDSEDWTNQMGAWLRAREFKVRAF